MQCMLFGDTITFAPNIKNWWQAISLAGANYIGDIMEGMMAGAAVGMGGAFIGGARTAFLQGGTRAVGQAGLNVLKSIPANVLQNIGATFGYAGGFSTTSVAVAGGLRGLTAAQAGLRHYGNTGESGWGAAGKGVFGMEEGMAHSVSNIATGNATWQDIAGLALLVSPVHEAVKDATITKEKAPTQEGDFEAFEAEPIKPKKGGAHKDLDFDNSIAEGKKVETVEQRHHMPSQESGNKGGNGGAITMETPNHKETSSYDNIRGSKNYRNMQKKLVDEGKFKYEVCNKTF